MESEEININGNQQLAFVYMDRYITINQFEPIFNIKSS
jgi:hypothetical protein